jgi:L-cysteine desulfidase
LNLASARKLLNEEIVRVTGCTEPASVAYAFMMARRNLTGRFDPQTIRAELIGSREVLRNASTAVVPFCIRRRGLRTVVARVVLKAKASISFRDGYAVRSTMTKRRIGCRFGAREKIRVCQAVLRMPMKQSKLR